MVIQSGLSEETFGTQFANVGPVSIGGVNIDNVGPKVLLVGEVLTALKKGKNRDRILALNSRGDSSRLNKVSVNYKITLVKQ